MKEIPLTQGRVALVDDEDYPSLSKYNWCAALAKNKTTYYAVRTVNGKGVPMHPAIMDAPAGVLVDHKDGDGLNNQRRNLRMADTTQNGFNKRISSLNKSGYKGVHEVGGRWRAKIEAGRGRYHLGYFDTPEAAARAYDAKARELHGEFARLNFPDPSDVPANCVPQQRGGQIVPAKQRKPVPRENCWKGHALRSDNVLLQGLRRRCRICRRSVCARPCAA